MEYETIIYAKEDNTAIITLNRPKKLNAINQRMIDELGDIIINTLAKDDDIRAVILTGEGRAFSAGADLTEALAMPSAAEAYGFSRKYQILFNRFEELPKPVIAAINGLALGGGCELALVGDLRIASEEATLAVTEVNLGAFPAGGGTQRLPRLIGATRAKEMLFLGDTISAQEAHSWGLVNKVVAKDRLMDEARELAGKLCAQFPPALKQLKILVNQGMNMDLVSGLELEVQCFTALVASRQGLEPPKWRKG